MEALAGEDLVVLQTAQNTRLVVDLRSKAAIPWPPDLLSYPQ